MHRVERTFRVMLLITLSTTLSVALPRFSLRTGAKCSACHVNPTGKGMRTEFGRSYASEDLSIPTWRERTDLEDFSTTLTPNISVGMDMRTLLFLEQQSGRSSALQMQGDLYFDFRLNKYVRIYLDKGLYSGFEVFALAKGLPADGYLKVGKFMPAYGTRVDDHNAFIRGGPFGGGPFTTQFTPFNAAGIPTGLRFGERSEDTGVELGFAPGMFNVQLGVFNGNPGGGLNGVTATSNKALAARGEALVKLDGINVSAGGSFYYGPSAVDKQTYTGAFGGISFGGRYTLTSEVDLVKVQRAGATTNGLMFWNEFNAMVIPGIDLKLGYEFYDPDKDAKSGSFTRAVVGAEFFVMSGVEFRPLYRINLESPVDLSNNELQAMLHFYF